MVLGRPRANKCDSCRRRHAKCDFLNPICTPCREHGFSCERPSSEGFVQYHPKKKTLQIVKRSWASSTHETRGSIVPSRALILVQDEQVWLAHFHHTFSSDAQSKLEDWTGMQAVSFEPNSLARKSLVALSCSFFGRSHNHDDLIQRGNGQYVHCLREINVQLDSPALRTSPETLLAVAIFGYYECLLLTAQFAWIKHYTGLAHMLEMAGPEACSDPVVFDVFRQSRFLLTLAALGTQTDSFLSRPEWKSLPWQLQKAPKNCMDEFFDIFADLPGLSAGGRSETAEKARSILRRLDDCYSAWSDAMDADLVLADASDPNYPSAWLGPLTSLNLRTANSFCMYNAAVIVAAEHALRNSEAKDLRPGDASILFHRRYEAAVGICRTIDYHFDSSTGASGVLFILWPLRMAAKVLSDGTHEEKLWLEQRRSYLAQSQGIWDIRREVFSELGGL